MVLPVNPTGDFSVLGTLGIVTLDSSDRTRLLGNISIIVFIDNHSAHVIMVIVKPRY